MSFITFTIGRHPRTMAVSVILGMTVLILGRSIGGEGYNGATELRTFQADGERVRRLSGQWGSSSK